MLMPKRVKRRKQFRGTMAGKAMRGNKINYGEYCFLFFQNQNYKRFIFLC